MSSDLCWATLHVCILVLTCGAFFLPHWRLITWADFQPAAHHPLADTASSIAGRTLTWIWATGAVAFVAVCIGGILRATSLVRRAARDEGMTQSLCQAQPALSAAPQPIEIRVLPDGVSPFCWQMHRPVIVLPGLVRDFPAAEQAAIVRHEIAHIRLQHPLHLFLQRLVEAIYWFHPLVWWASRQAAAAREFRCDRDAVNSRARGGRLPPQLAAADRIASQGAGPSARRSRLLGRYFPAEPPRQYPRRINGLSDETGR